MGSSMTCVKNEALGHRVTMDPDGNIYHEKQSRELCALHALNNLCQDRVFTKRDLDNICYKLSPDAYVNPHKSMFGLGNYDVNVIMAALQTKNLDTVWFDKRKDITGLVMENIHGLILNIPMDYKWGILHLPLRRKHWIVIRKVGRHYYNLDSKLDLPELIGTLEDLRKYLLEQMECKDKELLLVVNQLVSASASWWRPPPPGQGKEGKDKAGRGGRNTQEKNNAPLAQTEEDKSQEIDYTIDCHIVAGEVEKPKHLKKYHQDYVPIEIHRTYHKKDNTMRGSQDLSQDTATTGTTINATTTSPRATQDDMAPVEVEAKAQTVSSSAAVTSLKAGTQEEVDNKRKESPPAEMNGDLATTKNRPEIGGENPVVVVKEVEEIS